MLRIPIARLGRWYHPIYKNRKGEPVVEFTQEDFDSIIDVFNTDDRGYEPYLTYGHLKDKFDKFTVDGFPVVGYLKSLEQEDDVLYGDFQPSNDKVSQEIEDGNYRYASGEFIPNAKAKKTDQVLRMFLKGVALTNTPFIPNLPTNKLKALDDYSLGKPFVLLTDCMEDPDESNDKLDQDQQVVEDLDSFTVGDKFLVPNVVKGVLLVAINTANRVDPAKYIVQIQLAQDLIDCVELTLDLANRLALCYKEIDDTPDYLAEMLCGGDSFRIWVSQALESIEKVVAPIDEEEGPDSEMSEEIRPENTQDNMIEKTEDVKEIKSMLSEFTDWMKTMFAPKASVEEVTVEAESEPVVETVLTEVEPPVVEIEEIKVEEEVKPVAPAIDAEMLAKLATMEDEKAKLEAAVKELTDKANAFEQAKLDAERAAADQRLSDKVADLTNRFGLVPAVADKVRNLVTYTNETTVSLSDGNQINLSDAIFDLVNSLMDDSSRVDLDQVGAAGDVNALSDDADNPWADTISKYRAQSK